MADRKLLFPLLLVALVALFLLPYVFLGRSMLPLELAAIFQPWARHARELWETVPPVHNPLLDALQQYYPRRVYMREALGEGWLPLWNPGVYGGTPFLAAQQGAVLYPPAWLLALFAPEMQFGWSALLHLSLAAVGMFLFLRRMEIGAAGAVAGAVAFAFNGFMIVWLAYPNVGQWTLAWLPLALYLWERGRAGDDLRWLAASGLVLALNLLGGHGQSSAYVLLSWGAWALFRSLTARRPVRALLRWTVLPAALAVALSMGHLLPVLEYVPLTDRGQRVPWESVQAAGMPLAQLWTFLLPRLFGDETLHFAHASTWLPLGEKAQLAFIERSYYPGAAVLVLAAGGWAARRNSEHRRLALFSLALALVAVILAFGTWLYWPLWRFLPGFGNFTAVARIICIAAWPLASLAALGVHTLAHPEHEVRAAAFRAVGLVSAIGLVLALLGHFIYGGAAPAEVAQSLSAMGRPSPDALALRDLVLALVWLLAPAVLAGLAARGILRPALAGGLAAGIVAADLFTFGFSFNPAAETRYLSRSTAELDALRAAEEPFRFLSAGPPGAEALLQERMPSNLPSAFGLADIAGSDSFVPLRYRDWLRSTQEAAGGPSPWTRFGAPNLRAAAVEYYLTGGDTVRPGLEPVVGPALQRDPRALPYARLHTRVETLGSEADLLQALAQADRAPTIALTTGPDAPSYGGPPSVTPFETRRVSGNRLVLEGTAEQPGLLVVVEAFAPGWEARVDGQEARVVPADHWLVGIPLEPGQHRIELVYAPASLQVGLFFSLLALLALCALFIAPGRVRQDGVR